jgi:uncharacterized membrane protein YfcA
MPWRAAVLFCHFLLCLGVGVPPIQANATNTVALWPGQFTSIAAYWQDLKANVRLVHSRRVRGPVWGGWQEPSCCCTPGKPPFIALVPWLLLLGRWAIRRQRTGIAAGCNAYACCRVPGSSVPTWLPLWIGVVAVSFYIGYFGAGAGFLLMSVLALFGIQNINQVNALKVIGTATANGIAVVTFVVEKADPVWKYCLLMMIAAAGGWLSRALGTRAD